MNRSSIHRRRDGQRGFTFVELMLGMAVTALVGGAMSAAMLAVSRQWQAQQEGQSLQLAARQASVRLERVVSDARALGWSEATLLFLWRGDDNDDGRLQISELALLEYDGAGKSLKLWEYQGEASETALPPETLRNRQEAQDFKRMAQVRATPLAGGGNGASLRAVSASWTLGGDALRRPVVRYALGLQREGRVQTVAGAAMLRSPLRAK